MGLSGVIEFHLVPQLRKHLSELHVKIDRNDERNSVQAVYGDYGCQECERLIEGFAGAPELMTRLRNLHRILSSDGAALGLIPDDATQAFQAAALMLEAAVDDDDFLALMVPVGSRG